MESVLYDLRHAARQLRRRPLFTLVAALSIAIGIGATTAVLSVADTLLRRTAAGDAERAVEVTRSNGGRGRDTFSWPEFRDIRDGAKAQFEALAAWQVTPLSWSTGGGGERLTALMVSRDYFDALAVRPARGRFFLPEEDASVGTHAVAVVSDAFWRARMGGADDVLGRTIELNRHSFTIVGVAPPGFHGHLIGLRPDVFLPYMMLETARAAPVAWDDRQGSSFMAIGRLRPGVTVARAREAANATWAHAEARAEPRERRMVEVDPLTLLPSAGRGPVTMFMSLLLALTGLVLLVTCANVAGMLLARAAAREREIAVRLALGAGRSRLVRQLVAEALLVFAIGGTAGVALAGWATGLLGLLPVPAPFPVVLEFTPDWRVLGTGLALAALTGLLFGLAPALQATRLDLADTMKGLSAGGVSRMRRGFVMGQLGLSLLLLITSGLFTRSLQRAAEVPVGFDDRGVWTLPADFALDGYDSTRGREVLAQVLARTAASPGVSGAAAATDLPLDLGRSQRPAYLPGSPAATSEGWLWSDFNAVSPGYFEALDIAVRDGRGFETSDVSGAARVAVVSSAFADRVWPGERAVGRELRFGPGDSLPATVVGVVDDVKNSMLMEAVSPMYYLPLAQVNRSEVQLLVRGGPGTDPAAALRAAMLAIDPGLSAGPARALRSVTTLGILPQRAAAAITTALGALALLLSALGVYGVTAFLVSQRTREIGVRMALGARERDVVRLVLRGGLVLAVPGLLLGLGAGFGLSVVLRSMLLGLAPGDPVTFVVVPLVLLGAVAAACWAPARRAVAIQPGSALRSD